MRRSPNSARRDVLGGRRNLVCIAAGIGLAAYSGCDSKDNPAAPTKPPTAMGQAKLTLIAPDSLKWSCEEACARLADGKLGVSAAVRLVRLGDAAPLCVPRELTDEHVRRLRLMRLGEERWVLGLADRKDERRLRAPILISARGDVTLPAAGVDEEVLVLCVSKDADVFPHLLLLPERVLLVERELTPAIVLEPEPNVRFELRRERGFNYVALVLPAGGEGGEVARYRWDPYELTFLGPAMDRLPDPPGGKFRIDLKASRRLEPVGGELPEPEPIKEKPRRAPAADDDWLPA